MKNKSFLGIIPLVMFFLFPMFAMSKGSSEDILVTNANIAEQNIEYASTDIKDEFNNTDDQKTTSEQSSRKLKFLKKIDTLLKEKKEITWKEAGGYIQWLFKNDPAQIYLSHSFLENGDDRLKIETLEMIPVIWNSKNGIEKIKYNDINGSTKVFSKEESINLMLKLSSSHDCALQVLSCYYLAKLGYSDDNTINILLSYSLTKNFENWNIDNTFPFYFEFTELEKNDYIANNYKGNSALEKKISDAKYTLRYWGKSGLISLYENGNIKAYEAIQKLLSSSQDSEFLKSLKLEIENINLKQKKSKEINDNKLWDGNASAEYCIAWYDSFNTSEYNDYSTMGGDCANFGSQCLIAGNLDLSDAPDGYTDAFNCIFRTDSLHKYLAIHRSDIKSSFIDFSIHPEWQNDPHSQIPSWFRTGDIALMGKTGDDLWKHTIINHGGNGTSALFGCHSAPNLNSTLDYGLWINYLDGELMGFFDCITFYHVIGSTVLESPSQDSLIVALGDTLNLQALVTNNTEPTSLNPITNFKFVLKKKPENTVATLWETTNAPPSADSTYVFDFETALQDTGRYILYANTTYSTGSTQDSCIVKIKAYPEIQTPSNNEIIHVRSSTKGTVQDTVAIKVKVPEILGLCPTIKIKIDDVYVNQGDITFDPAENLWVYNWVVSSINPGTEGKRFLVVAEINGTPSCYDATGVYLVESVFYEDFETMSDLVTEGWAISSYEYPVQTYTGWALGNDELDAENQCAKSHSFINSTAMSYRLYTPAITIPDGDGVTTKLEYKIYFNRVAQPYSQSYMKMNICNTSNAEISTWTEIYAIDGQWADFQLDLTPFAGQSIKIEWNHYYVNASDPVEFNTYCLDDVIVYTIPDMEGANIDFISGNSAELNEDMNLMLQFNDTSGIDGVTADYSIESDSDTITLYPVKGTYNYTGTIPARDHECAGTISFKIKDSVGNETISSGHTINWAVGGPVLTAPQNVLMTVVNDSTLTITWDMVVGATGYKVYSSLDPYGSFAEDTTGTFTSSREWQKTFVGNKYFYYVVATDAVKKEEFEIAKATEDK